MIRTAPPALETVRDVHWLRVMALTATGLLLAFTAVELFVVVRGVVERGQFGADFGVHLTMAERWLDTGVMYGPNQLDRPYTNGEPWTPAGQVNMYPPIAMLLFAPFVWLPAFLWWAIPLGTTAAIILGQGGRRLVHDAPAALIAPGQPGWSGSSAAA